MFRPFIGSLSGLLLNEVNECYVHVRIPTMLSNSRNVTYVKIELHKIDGIVYNKKSGFYFSAGTKNFPFSTRLKVTISDAVMCPNRGVC